MDELILFSANSTNDNNNKHLWVKGASLIIPQLNILLQLTNYKFNIIDIEFFENGSAELGNILEKNMSDKSTSHNYHILYSYILKSLGVNSNLNILEIGLGTNNPSLISTMGGGGRPGASLYAFKEYLPNSNIYGCDIDKDILFNCDRIQTYYVDQLDFLSFYNFSIQTNNICYDMIIDDGLHSIGANFNTLLFALDRLNNNGWIVIEDIHIIENWKSIDFILSSNPIYKTYIIKAKGGYLYVVHKIIT